MSHLTTIAALPGFGNGLAQALKREVPPASASVSGQSLFDQMVSELVLAPPKPKAKVATKAAQTPAKGWPPKELSKTAMQVLEEQQRRAASQMEKFPRGKRDDYLDALSLTYLGPREVAAMYQQVPEHRHTAKPLDPKTFGLAIPRPPRD